jgi:hypothetical protein
LGGSDLRLHAGFDRHGGKTVILARFVPRVRTFAPFVAGVGRMGYVRFLTFSVAGAVLWVVPLVGTGYFFGNFPLVPDKGKEFHSLGATPLRCCGATPRDLRRILPVSPSELCASVVVFANEFSLQ